MSDPSPRPSSWSPLLSGDLARRAHRALAEIVDELDRRTAAPSPPAPVDPSLAAGLAGQALCFAHADAGFPGRGYDERALDLLERAVDQLSQVYAVAGLYSGFAGVGWVAEHFRGWLLDPGDDPAEEVARALRDHLGQSPWQRHYDLIGGVVGLGLFALERYPLDGARESIELAVDRLAGLVERQGAACTWRTPPELLTPEVLAFTPHGHHDLGVAHGVAGVIAFLSAVSAAGLGAAAARELLDGAIAWLLSCKRTGARSVFPSHVAPESTPPSRLAWCYGDLGIATVLLGAARRIGDPALEREALEVAQAAARRPVELSGVRDAGLCHGAAGVGHLFNRLHQATGDPLLAGAARAWFAWALDDRKPGQGCAGFLAWGANERGEMEGQDDAGFLTGSAGIGLALLAALYPSEPSWDRVLLASIPQPAGTAR
jgi:lantibiotic modifying enzyme